MRALLAVTFLAAALSARCANQAGDPVQSYLDFQSNVKKGELSAAWAGLSSDTRAALEKRSKELSDASGGAIKNDPMALFFSGSAARSPDVSEVKLIDRQEGRATLSAKAGDQTQVVKLVKEADGWKVDLTESLRP